MNDWKCAEIDSSEGLEKAEASSEPQLILVMQQNNSAQSKIEGIRKFGLEQFRLEIFSIDEALPPIIDDGSEYLPTDIRASLVLDFLKHPDLSQDLAILCQKKGVPMVASGKKLRTGEALTPLT